MDFSNKPPRQRDTTREGDKSSRQGSPSSPEQRHITGSIDYSGAPSGIRALIAAQQSFWAQHPTSTTENQLLNGMSYFDWEAKPPEQIQAHDTNLHSKEQSSSEPSSRSDPETIASLKASRYEQKKTDITSYPEAASSQQPDHYQPRQEVAINHLRFIEDSKCKIRVSDRSKLNEGEGSEPGIYITYKDNRTEIYLPHGALGLDRAVYKYPLQIKNIMQGISKNDLRTSTITDAIDKSIEHKQAQEIGEWTVRYIQGKPTENKQLADINHRLRDSRIDNHPNPLRIGENTGASSSSQQDASHRQQYETTQRGDSAVGSGPYNYASQQQRTEDFRHETTQRREKARTQHEAVAPSSSQQEALGKQLLQDTVTDYYIQQKIADLKSESTQSIGAARHQVNPFKPLADLRDWGDIDTQIAKGMQRFDLKAKRKRKETSPQQEVSSGAKGGSATDQ